MNRVIFIKDEQAKTMALNLLRNLPFGGLDIIVAPHKEKRTLSQNAYLWAAVMADITQQAWFKGRQYSQPIWHQYFKQEFMPDMSNSDLAILVKDFETYEKWMPMPDGTLKCVASTTQLTKKGMAIYLENIYAFGSELGVHFSVKGEV